MEINFLKSVVLLLLHLKWIAGEKKSRMEIEKEILQNIFFTSKFHVYIRPEKNVNQTNGYPRICTRRFQDEPLDISVSLYVLSTDIDIINQECNIQMYFRQEWNDSRLAYDNQGVINALDIHDTLGFWTPDLFFVNEKRGQLHIVTKPNIFVRIYPQGKVLFSQRLSIKVFCPMDLRKYPFDMQTCTLPIESYAYTADNLILKWKPEITFGLNEPPGYLISYSTLEEIIHVGENNYSRLELNIHFTRLIIPQLFHIYIPLGLLVVTSWISFWLRPFCYLPRLTTSIITSFITVMFIQSTKHFFYYTSHVSALDIWVAFSCFLIFAAVFENIYVIAIHSDLQSSTFLNERILKQEGSLELKKDESKERQKISKYFKIKFSVEKSNIDGLARLMFPSIFTLFNIIYLAYYLI